MSMQGVIRILLGKSEALDGNWRRDTPFHGENTGSIPVGRANEINELEPNLPPARRPCLTYARYPAWRSMCALRVALSLSASRSDR
jgi:hypothetical protein